MMNKKNVGSYFIVPGLIIIVYGIIYWMRGIYPFGDGNISYYDMAQSFVPIYEHCCDVLHGRKYIWFDWFSGAGEGMVSLAGWSILNPINWILYFVPEGKLLQFMSVFLLIKLVCCSVSVQFYLENRFGADVKAGWKLLFAFIYANSGYVLQFYTNIYFLDMVMLFPILVYAMEEMHEKGKMKLYIVMLTLALTFNLYFSFMFLLYILFCSLGYILFLTDKNQRGRASLRLGVSTIVALGLSAWMWVPTAIQMLNSPRMQGGSGYAGIITRVDNYLVGQKEWHLFGTEIAVAVILAGGVRLFLKTRRIGKYYLYMLVLMLLPIWIEGTDLLWHTGSYVMFPMRFGFMTVFVVLIAAMHIVKEKCFEIRCPWETAGLVMYLLVPALGAMLGYIFYEYIKEFRVFGIVDMDNYRLTALFMILYIVCYLMWCIYYRNFNKVTKSLTLVFVLGIQMVVGISSLVAPERCYSKETDEYYITDVNEMRDAWSIYLENNNLNRIKCADVSLNMNYPLMLKYPAISGWTNVANANIGREMQGMGYSTVGESRLIDAGGTVFSDALLGYDKAVAKGEMNETLYEKVATSGEYCLYDRKYVINPGVYVEEGFANLKYDSDVYGNGFEYQNEIFKSLTGAEEELITIVELGEPVRVEKGVDLAEDYRGYNRFFYKIYSEEKSVIYLRLEREKVTERIILEEDGKMKEFRFLETETPEIPYYGNNNLVELTVAEGENEICLCTKAEEVTGVSVGMLNIGLMEQHIKDDIKTVDKLRAGAKSVEFSIDAGEKGYIFLPIGYDGGWNCVRNNEKVELKSCLGESFVLVPVEKGNNDVKMQYFPYGMKYGIIISILFGVFALVLKKVIKYIESKSGILSNMAYGIFMIVSVAGMLIVYILPVVGYFVTINGSRF